MAKKLESSQATAKHMRQVIKEPQATQVNLLRHQRTELPPSKFQRKQNKRYRSRQAPNKQHQEDKYKERMSQANGRFLKNPQEYKRRSDHEHTRPDRCHESGNSKHIEGFQCSARKYQCRNCHKFGHFSSLCYKIQESYKKKPRSPKTYQLTSGRISAEDKSMYRNTSDSSSSEDESFCLQMKVQAKQANQKYPAPKHLFTNLEFKVKPCKIKTKLL